MLVQTLRLKNGWTQEQLATVSGVSVRTIQRIERGEAASAESLKALAAAFDVDFQALKEPAMDTTLSTPSATARLDAELLLAFDHVRRKRTFFGALTAYMVVIPVLAGLNVFVWPKHPWAVYPAVIWAAVMLLAWIRLAGWSPWGVAWERREVEKRLGRPL